MRKIIVIALVLLVAQFLTITRIQPFTPELLIPCFEEKRVSFQCPELEEIVKRPLHYLNNGNEAIAFVSADDRYVIKFLFERHFFSLAHFKPKERIRQLQGAKSRIDKAQEALRRYEQGLKFLPEETAMIAVHQYRCPEVLPCCTIVNREGKEYTLDLNNYAFIVQKKCELMTKAQFVENQETLYPKFQELFAAIANQGFVNDSGTFFLPNFAILDGKAVMIDLGKLKYCPEEAYTLEEERFQERYEARLQKCIYRIR